MTATRQDIERWLEQAKEKGSTHLIVVVDRYNHFNYPVYVGSNKDIKKEIKRIESQSMQGIDEVYNMSMDIDEQLAQYRAYNI